MMLSGQGKKSRCRGYVQWIPVVLCITGFCLSYYAYHVETTKEENEDYQAMCDISEHISCSAVFTSRYGKGFGLLSYVLDETSILNQPNSVYGMVFYVLLAVLAISESITLARIQVLLSVISNVSSVYLAYILYFILYDFCVVCVTTYAINAIILACSICKLKYFSEANKKEV